MLLVVSLHYSADEFFKSDMAVNHERETQETEKKIANDGLIRKPSAVAKNSGYETSSTAVRVWRLS